MFFHEFPIHITSFPSVDHLYVMTPNVIGEKLWLNFDSNTGPPANHADSLATELPSHQITSLTIYHLIPDTGTMQVYNK